ncbi:hypothetical protein [Nonomuraea aurantiaca]|uniref:hypothetical protein n=1 Tax=Nonomuraea aurantiaca TaxID=2878562 RepID=UPI001CD9DAB8|nr:hypothetical protein [Nonomuraea aurantiaca]MCA2230444.1 hypothetical protein [Nonomuraea aurantiaca]
MERYGTVKPFIEQLASVIPWGETAAGSPIVAAVKAPQIDRPADVFAILEACVWPCAAAACTRWARQVER